MFTQKEKTFLLTLLNRVPITGTRETIMKTMEEINALVRKIEQMPTQDETPGKQGPAKKK